MKCKHCDGKGYAYVRTAPNPITGYGYKRVCDYCHGTGEIKQTEQEWLQTCNTEQLAEVIGNIAKNAYQCGQNGKTNKCVNRNHCTGYCDYGWGEWLKQPHTKEGTK